MYESMKHYQETCDIIHSNVIHGKVYKCTNERRTKDVAQLWTNCLICMRPGFDFQHDIVPWAWQEVTPQLLSTKLGVVCEDSQVWPQNKQWKDN